MKIPIIVNIEAGKNGECGECSLRADDACEAFGGWVLVKLDGPNLGIHRRLPACLAAEQKTRDLIKAGEDAEIILVDEGYVRPSMRLNQALAAVKED